MQKHIDAIETLKCVKINLDITDGENPSRTAAFDLAIYALEQLEKSRWIPVDERMPEEKPKKCLCTNGEYIWISNWLEVMGNYCWDCKGIVTAWMPIPEPTKSNLIDRKAALDAVIWGDRMKKGTEWRL